VRALAGRAADFDGVVPLNEEAQFSLVDTYSRHVLVSEGEALIGYLNWQPALATVQLVVDPEWRRRGVGTRLWGELPDPERVGIWAFGDLEPARGFAASLGLRPARSLLVMARPLAGLPAATEINGLSLRGYQPTDAAELLAVNAAAFVHHHEQGSLDATGLATRMAEDWFDPDGLILGFDADGLAGFHWTKTAADSGEVYVVAVAPRAQGRGYGKALLDAGMSHLAAKGLPTVELYVDSADEIAVRMYERAGFIEAHRDVFYESMQQEQSMTFTDGHVDLDEHAEGLPELPADRYNDRELSWLAFNERVLDLARDSKRVPLLERARFLAIFSGNLDEFFMVRVAGLKRRIAAGVAVPSNSGMMPGALMATILDRTRDLVNEVTRVFADEIRPELAANGIQILAWTELNDEERRKMTELFENRIFPVLTPLAVDPSHPFPYISGLSVNLAVLVMNPTTGVRQFARVKVPTILSRFVSLGNDRFIPLEEVIAPHLGQLFSGMEIVAHSTFRVTRNEDVEVEEDDAENLLFALEKELLRRKTGRPPVRLEVEADINEGMLELLISELDIDEGEVFKLPRPLDLRGLFSLADLNRDSLKYPSFLPKTHPELAKVETAQPADMFAALKSRDVLLQHPYDSFATSVQRFIEQAAADPAVLAIKQTLYRTSGDSPIIDALIEAARAGKQVLALVEIKARFDEQANIAWARKLEKAGCHVVYGVLGLKTHCKLSLVVREEPAGLRRYCHIGTGNYNPKTARLYEDMGLLTSNAVITEDVAKLFNHLSGMSQETSYRRLLVAPHSVRKGLISAINREINNHRAGLPAGIRLKLNSIVDETITDALYRASQAGVPVDLWVRGICAVRPGIPGVSDNIRVRSILGRFLEHSRLFWFANGGHPQVGIGSADLMHRNLDRRVEVIVGLANPAHIAQIEQLFDQAFDEGTAAWWLDGEDWRQHTTNAEGEPLLDMQEHMISQMGQRRALER